jgi:hypothetical protein
MYANNARVPDPQKKRGHGGTGPRYSVLLR